MRPLVRRPLIALAVAIVLIGLPAAPASAAPGDPNFGTTEAFVSVSSYITLDVSTPSVTISGLPGDTVAGDAPVDYAVTTNNSAGYIVTLESETANLVASNGNNSDVIPIGALEVLIPEQGVFQRLINGFVVVVNRINQRSALAGDSYGAIFQMTIPDVNSDTYTATLDFVAATQ